VPGENQWWSDERVKAMLMRIIPTLSNLNLCDHKI